MTPLKGHTNQVWSVVALPDNARALSGGFDGTLRLWALASGECLKTIDCGTGDDNHVFSVAVDPAGTRVLSGHRDGSIRRWDLGTGEELATLTGHSGIVNSLQIGPDGPSNKPFAVSGSNDKTVRIWGLDAGRCVGALEGHQGQVLSVALSPDGALIASTGFTDETVRLWDRASGACLEVIGNEDDAAPMSVAFSPDGARLVVGMASEDDQGNIYVYRLTDARAAPPVGLPRRYVNAKVVLIGEGAVGKTSLAHRLMDDEYVIRDRTHGMNVWRLELPSSLSSSSWQGMPGPSARDGKDTLEDAALESGAPSEDDTLDREALLWDLAGQEDYRLIHRLFLEQTALALLLINPQKDDPFAEAGDWLKALESAREPASARMPDVGWNRRPAPYSTRKDEDAQAPPGKAYSPSGDVPGTARKSARLLVFSQIDVGGMKVSNAKIQRFCAEYGFTGWLATSAKTGENCSDSRGDKAASSHPSKHQWIRALQKQWRWMRVESATPAYPPSKLKQLIADSIPWEQLPWTATPKLLAELKNAVMEMRDETDIRLLRFSELEKHLRRALPGEGFAEADVRTAVTLLANHGLALPLAFGDLVLLQPELLNGYAGAIIRGARAHVDEIGCVAESAIHDPGFDFTGVVRLPRPDEELLLRALVQTFLDRSLCIAEETSEGQQLVFPSQYRRERDIPWQPDVFVSYTFSGEWQSVWTTLVVRLWYSSEFEHRELWRNAAEFQSSRGHLLGLKIDNRQGEGEATISLFFDVAAPDELKVILIEYVHRHLAKYATEVRRDRRYVCPKCGTAVTNLGAVRRRREKGKAFITCQECDEKVPFRDFIEERLESDPVARKILKMEETATRQLDNQALEQILIGHMLAVCGEANQIFRPVTMFDVGIDGEVEFKFDNGKPSGRRIYVQLKSGNSYLRERKSDGREVFDVKNERHLDYWVEQPVDVYLVIRQTGGLGERGDREGTIRWMNVTRYLEAREDKTSRQIIFTGEKLDRQALWRARDGLA
ncbi:MAG: WD domain-containing protein, G-beta repeat-containing protein [Candidatus Kentron sp. G]|nr:MAG: WD domain-containing protein, G-beta repeat-containing protein [Candidatus Kentron sp. G]